MSDSTLHEWLTTPEAEKACRLAVEGAIMLQGVKALVIGREELLNEARALLAECAAPRPEDADPDGCARCGASLEGVRKGSKFCSTHCRDTHKNARRGNWRAGDDRAPGLPDVPLGHIGSMHKWPADDRLNYAIKEVGHRLANYAVSEWTRHPADARDWGAEVEDLESREGSWSRQFYDFRAVAGGKPGYLEPGWECTTAGHGPAVQVEAERPRVEHGDWYHGRATFTTWSERLFGGCYA